MQTYLHKNLANNNIIIIFKHSAKNNCYAVILCLHIPVKIVGKILDFDQLTLTGTVKDIILQALADVGNICRQTQSSFPVIPLFSGLSLSFEVAG